MELQTLETVVQRLFSDADFRSRALANTGEAFADYELDADQLTALGSLCERLDGEQGLGVSPKRMWF